MRAAEGGHSFETVAWMRNAQMALYLFMAVAALSGLTYLFAAAFAGQVLRAIVGALVAVGGVAAGLMGLTALRFAVLMAARTRPLDQVVARVTALESAVEHQVVTVDLARGNAEPPDKLVAANVELDAFPRLVRPDPADLPAEPGASPQPVEGPTPDERRWQAAYQNGDIAACRRTLVTLRTVLAPERVAAMEDGLHALSQAKAFQLREEFARLIRAHDYAAALTTGEQIAALFPESAMTREYEALRPQLCKCAGHASEAASPSPPKAGAGR